jgi:hypothetical protein
MRKLTEIYRIALSEVRKLVKEDVDSYDDDIPARRSRKTIVTPKMLKKILKSRFDEIDFSESFPDSFLDDDGDNPIFYKVLNIYLAAAIDNIVNEYFDRVAK